MSLKNVLGQEHIAKTFKTIINNDCLAHAYIFLGTDGVGKSFFAKQLAKKLNCKNNGDDSCDTCSNCHKIDNDASSDLHWISAFKDKKFLGIDQVKTIGHISALTSVESKYKIFIIKEADKLTEEAANCILKILEEPPNATLIILLVNSLDYLPETVISRCQIMRFATLSNSLIFNVLNEKFDKESVELEWATQVSNGSIGTAIKFVTDDLYSKNQLLVKSLSGLTINDNFNLANEIISWAELKEKEKTFEGKRSYVKLILNLVLKYYRDILMYKTQNSRFLTGSKHDNIKTNRDFTPDQATIIKIIDQIFIAFYNLESNANINLLIENLFTGIALALSEKTA